MDLVRMDTRLSLEKIKTMVTSNPAKLLPDGTVVCPPARLSFANLGAPGKNTLDPGKPGKYGTNLLFTQGADLTALKKLRDGVLASAFPHNPKGAGMKPAFRDQGDKIAPSEGGTNATGKTYKGFTPGAAYIIPTSNHRPGLWVPPIVNGMPTPFAGDAKEIDTKFHSGVWAMAVVNAYASKNAQNPGVWFGLLSLLFIEDDNSLGGAGGNIDAKAAFGSAVISNTDDVSSLFG